jgi:hypothetical protein
MAVSTCPDCDGPVSDRAAACPHCGCPVAGAGAGELGPSKATGTAWGAVAGVIIVIALVGLGIAGTHAWGDPAGRRVTPGAPAVKRELPVNPVTTDRCVTCILPPALDELLAYRERGDKIGEAGLMKGGCWPVPAGVKTSVSSMPGRTALVTFHGWKTPLMTNYGAVETDCLE